jgi:hypothetical protein
MSYDAWLLSQKDAEDEQEAIAYDFYEAEANRIADILIKEVEGEIHEWMGNIPDDIEDKVIELAEMIARHRSQFDTLVNESIDDEPYSPYDDR